jgi:hypothetical protein
MDKLEPNLNSDITKEKLMDDLKIVVDAEG